MIKSILNALLCLCLGLGLFCAVPAYAADSVVSIDYVSSIRKKAEQGDPVSEFNMAVLYHTGQGVPEGVPQDDVQTARWLRKAADQGYADAELNLAALYHDGQGVPQDYKQAAEWCRRSAEQGNVKAQFYLSNLYKKGEGVPQDENLAMAWLVRAVKGGGNMVTPQEVPKADKTAPPKGNGGVLYLAAAFAILLGCFGFRFFRRRRQ